MGDFRLKTKSNLGFRIMTRFMCDFIQ